MPGGCILKKSGLFHSQNKWSLELLQNLLCERRPMCRTRTQGSRPHEPRADASNTALEIAESAEGEKIMGDSDRLLKQS